MGGVTSYAFRVLCESPFEGGGGYTPEQVGNMTLDQIWFRLCDIKMLKDEIGFRTDRIGSNETAVLKPGPDGLVAGRSADGKPIRARLGGKSVARQRMEELAARRQAEKGRKRKKRRGAS